MLPAKTKSKELLGQSGDNVELCKASPLDTSPSKTIVSKVNQHTVPPASACPDKNLCSFGCIKTGTCLKLLIGMG